MTYHKGTALAAAGLSMALAGQAVAQTDFSGATVNFVIPFTESGGSSQWSNFYAPQLSRALAGNPTVVVRYRPGAGSTQGANWFQGELRNNDGLLLFGDSASTKFPYLLDDPRVRYNYDDWHPILASATGGVVFLPPDLGARFDGSMNDLQDVDFLYGSQGATTLDLVPLLAFKMLGMTVDPVFGVNGRGDGRLMFERGEANIDYQTSSSYIANVLPLVEDGLAVPIFTWGALNDAGEIVRDPTFPDLPTFNEVCEATDGCETEGTAWEAFRAFVIAGFANQKTIFVPATTPPEVIETYTAALQEIVNAPGFAEASEEVLGIYPQLYGEAAVTATRQATTISDEAKQYVLDWLRDDYGVTMD